MLEAMSRPAAYQHYIGHCRMPVDQEVAVRAIFILADFGADHRRSFQERETAVAEGDYLVERGAGWLARLGVGVDRYAMHVMGELDAAPLQVGEAVIHVAVVEI